MTESPDNTAIDARDASDRRPVRSRQWVLIQRMADVIVGWGVSPNTVSLSSMAFSAVGAAMMAGAARAEGVGLRLLCVGALLCVQLRLLANVLDGIVAERTNQSSLAGKLFNEWPDRVSDCLLLIGFGWLVIEPSRLWLGPLAACVAVATAYVRELGRAIDAPPMYMGPLAKPQRMALLTVLLFVLAVWPGAVTAPLWGSGGRYGLVETGLWVFILGGVITIARRLRALHRFAAAQPETGHDHH